MINGDPKEFIEGLYYGDERFYYYEGCKYFIQGYFTEGKPMLEIYGIEPSDNTFEWRAVSDNKTYPVPQFENAAIFHGKTFWQVEQNIEWSDF